MRKTTALILLAILLGPSALLKAQTNGEPERARLLRAKAGIQQQLDQRSSELVRASLEERLRKVERRLKELGEPSTGPGQPTEAGPLSRPGTEKEKRTSESAEASPAPEPEIRPGPPEDVIVQERPRLLERAPGPSRFEAQFSVLSRYQENYFQAEEGSPQHEVFVTELTARFRAALFSGKSRALTAELGLQRNIVRNLDGTDSSLFTARLGYLIGPNQFGLTPLYIPRRRLFVVGTQPVHGSIRGIGVGHSLRIGRRLRTNLNYRVTQVSHGNFRERNSVSHRFGGDGSYRFDDRFSPGIGLELTRLSAQTSNYTYTELAPVFLVSSRFRDLVAVNLRYRYRVKDYPVNDAAESNFNREDRRHDLSFYSTVRLGPYTDLLISGAYIRHNSTRTSHSFLDPQLGIGMLFRIPGQ